MISKICILVTMVCILGFNNVNAEDYYLFTNYGMSEFDAGNTDFGNSYTLAVGYDLSTNFSIEIDYSGLGSSTQSSDVSVLGQSNTISQNNSSSIIGISFVGNKKILNTNIFILGKLGYGRSSFDTKQSLAQPSNLINTTDTSSNNSDFYYEIGLGYKMFKNIDLSLTYSFYSIEQDVFILNGNILNGVVELDVNIVGLGVKYNY